MMKDSSPKFKWNWYFLILGPFGSSPSCRRTEGSSIKPTIKGSTRQDPMISSFIHKFGREAIYEVIDLSR